MSLTGIAADPRVLLFDVGGVLVQLSGVETMLGWMGETATSEEMWRMWLHSTPVREFERGRIGAARVPGFVQGLGHRALPWSAGDAGGDTEFVSARSVVQ
jgi:hypothetical protein